MCSAPAVVAAVVVAAYVAGTTTMLLCTYQQSQNRRLAIVYIPTEPEQEASHCVHTNRARTGG